MISKLAIMARDNEPLYLEDFGHTDAAASAKANLQIHSSIDLLEDKIASLVGASGANADMYLGTLLSIEDTRIYGYCTNTRAKFVAVARDGASDATVKALFLALHTLYINAIANPFHEPNSRLDSPNFCTAVRQLVTSFNKAASAPPAPSPAAALVAPVSLAQHGLPPTSAASGRGGSNIGAYPAAAGGSNSAAAGAAAGMNSAAARLAAGSAPASPLPPSRAAAAAAAGSGVGAAGTRASLGPGALASSLAQAGLGGSHAGAGGYGAGGHAGMGASASFNYSQITSSNNNSISGFNTAGMQTVASSGNLAAYSGGGGMAGGPGTGAAPGVVAGPGVAGQNQGQGGAFMGIGSRVSLGGGSGMGGRTPSVPNMSSMGGKR